MNTKQSERRRLRAVLLAGALTLLLFGTVDWSAVTFGSSDAFYPDTTKEILMIKIAQAADAAEKIQPPIDLAAPAQTETATFALG